MTPHRSPTAEATAVTAAPQLRETARDHVANALQMLMLAKAADAADVVGNADELPTIEIDRDGFNAVCRRLQAALNELAAPSRPRSFL